MGTFLNYAVKEFAEGKSEEIKSSYKSLYPKSDEMHLVYLIRNNQKSIKLFCNKFVDKYKESIPNPQSPFKVIIFQIYF